MPVNRRAFQRLPINDFPKLTCPKCRESLFQLVTSKTSDGPTYHTCHTLLGHAQNKSLGNSPERITFLGWMQCLESRCRTLSAVFGEASENVKHKPYTYYEIRVTGFSNPPLLIARPKGLPDNLQVHLRLAELLIWIDPSAAATRLRVLLETLADHAQVPACNSKRRRIDLNQRIHMLLPDDDIFQEFAQALRLIGNEGAHAIVQLEEALDAFDFVEHCLKLQFQEDSHFENLRAKAKAKLTSSS